MIFKGSFRMLFPLGFAVMSSTLALCQAQAYPGSYTQEIAGTDLVIEMQSIPAGEFFMGSPEGEKNRMEEEGPAKKVKLDAFWMSKFEITWDLYYLFLERAIDEIENKKKAGDVNLQVDAISGATIPYVDMSLGMGTGEGLPVGNVTQLAASRFCQWLSAKTGYFYRLPTEAEWEYAARAGSQSAYHFGDDPEELVNYAWFYENSNETYKPVGQKIPNQWGLYDMHGNVAEWTLDVYNPDSYKKREPGSLNPLEYSEEAINHVVRGGSYNDDPPLLRSAARIAPGENWKMRDPQFPKSKWWYTDAPFVGFRVVRVVHPPAKEEYNKYWGLENH